MLKFTRRPNDEIEEYEDEEMLFDEMDDDADFDEGGFVKPVAAPAETTPAFASGAVSLKIINPKEYSEASEIADYLMNGNTVLLNIEGMAREQAIRLLDYIAGATHAVGGLMTKVGKTTIVVAPKNVDVSNIEAMVGN